MKSINFRLPFLGENPIQHVASWVTNYGTSHSLDVRLCVVSCAWHCPKIPIASQHGKHDKKTNKTSMVVMMMMMKKKEEKKKNMKMKMLINVGIITSMLGR